ncbi:MAG: CHAD domain-containing protein [Ignavibacteria bacterium]|jgi:CHAD domain-containing protein
MKKRYPVKKNRTLKENVKVILPLMYDDLMSSKDRVVGHPRLKTELHRMRITGKPMRYAMEYVENAFPRRFRECHDEIKDAIELMGEIHDCDVNIPEIGSHLNEIREFNRTVTRGNQRFMIKPVTMLIRQLRDKREKMYAELCTTLDRWQKEDFRSKLVTSMIEPPGRIKG